MNRPFLISSICLSLLSAGNVALAQQEQRPAMASELNSTSGSHGQSVTPDSTGQMGIQTVSAATLSLRTLTVYLGITDDQKGKIAQVREDAQEAAQTASDSQGSSARIGARKPTTRSSRGTQQTTFDTRVVQSIYAVLTDEQQNRLTALVQALQTLQAVGVRPTAAIKLQLSDEQLIKLANLNGNLTAGAVESILTEQQITVAQQYQVLNQASSGTLSSSSPGYDVSLPSNP